MQVGRPVLACFKPIQLAQWRGGDTLSGRLRYRLTRTLSGAHDCARSAQLSILAKWRRDASWD